jgi:hypothetical protein
MDDAALEYGLTVGSSLAEQALRMVFTNDPVMWGFQLGLLTAAHLVWEAYGATQAGGYQVEEMCLVMAAIDGRRPSYIREPPMP